MDEELTVWQFSVYFVRHAVDGSLSPSPPLSLFLSLSQYATVGSSGHRGTDCHVAHS
jgi:hypothetical protein